MPIKLPSANFRENLFSGSPAVVVASKQCQRVWKEAGTIHRGPAVRKGAPSQAVLHTFLPFSAVSVFGDCALSDQALVTMH